MGHILQEVELKTYFGGKTVHICMQSLGNRWVSFNNLPLTGLNKALPSFPRPECAMLRHCLWGTEYQPHPDQASHKQTEYNEKHLLGPQKIQSYQSKFTATTNFLYSPCYDNVEWNQPVVHFSEHFKHCDIVNNQFSALIWINFQRIL